MNTTTIIASNYPYSSVPAVQLEESRQTQEERVNEEGNAVASEIYVTISEFGSDIHEGSDTSVFEKNVMNPRRPLPSRSPDIITDKLLMNKSGIS